MLQDKNYDFYDNEGGPEQFVFQVPTVNSTVDGQLVKDIFDNQPETEGVVVMENSIPVGIIMRTAFFQKIGTLYGHSLYMKRSVSILMETDIMKVDVSSNISKIGIQAMEREQSKLYDYIIVYKNMTYIGVISIRLFLVELSKRNEAQISVLKNQHQMLVLANDQETQLRKSLEYQSASVRNILDNADQGFLWFNEDLVIKSEYSYKCLSIFNMPIGDIPFIDLAVTYFGQDKISVFEMAFNSYFNNTSPITDNVYLMLLPSDCLINGKNIHFQYRRIENDGKKAVMVILNDISEKISIEKAIEDDQNKQRLIIKAFSCQGQIKQIIEEFRGIINGGYINFFNSCSSFSNSLNDLFRSVHTFKGDFAQFGFVSASNRLHLFENALLEVVNQGDKATLSDVTSIMTDADPNKILEEDLNIISEILGSDYFDKSEVISIPKAKIVDIENTIKRSNGQLDHDAVIRLIDSLRRKNIKLLMEQYRDYLQYLANKLMKNMPIFIIEGDDIEIIEEQYGEFIKSLVHIFRNIMDHGIETDEERLENGKSEIGLVECQISKIDKNHFSICISDDGRGIDINKVKDKAIKNCLKTPEELENMSSSEICNLIFADHLSTKESADTLSGRGMGMSAVLEACESLGGKIKITTEENKGTSFKIELPLID